MKKILQLALVACLISCNSWNWKPDPYVGSSERQSVVNANGQEVFCAEPDFDSFTCFSAENLADLAAEIERVRNRNKKR